MAHKRKRWCEPLLSSLPCKLGSGKTRRKENVKEESIRFLVKSLVVHQIFTKFAIVLVTGQVKVLA